MKFAFYLNENITINVHSEMVKFFGNNVDRIESFHNVNQKNYYVIVHMKDLVEIHPSQRSNIIKKLKNNYKESGIIISKEISGYFL